MEHQQHYRSAGTLLVAANLLFLVAIAWHGLIHPFAGATAAESLPLIQNEASIWALAHMFFAFAAAILAASTLAVLSLRSPLTAALPGLAGWSTLAVITILGAGLAVMEATVQGDAAIAGDLETFSMWFALSRGAEILFALFPLAFLGIAADDLRSTVPATPRWASALALVGAALVLLAVIGATGLRMVAFGPLWSGAALPVLWLIWLGIRLATPGERTDLRLAADAT